MSEDEIKLIGEEKEKKIKRVALKRAKMKEEKRMKINIVKT